MEYISLNKLRNTYPTTTNYKKTSIDTIDLLGRFDGNFKRFNLPDVSVIEVVDNTSFKFIIELKLTKDDDEYIGLYTSPIFYNDIVTAYNENNPYSLRSPFLDEFIVKINLDELNKTYNSLISEEFELDVNVIRNIFYKIDDVPDYTQLIKYINWIVSTPNSNELVYNNVLPVTDISEYNFTEYNADTGLFEKLDNTIDDIRLSKLQNELSNVILSIDEIEDFIKNPSEAKLRVSGSAVARVVGPAGLKVLAGLKAGLLKGLLAKVGLSAVLGPVGIIGGTVVAAAALIVNLFKAKKKKKEQQSQIELHLNKLKSELTQLKERRLVLEIEINQIKSN